MSAQADYERRKTKKTQDIGPPPDVVNPGRRDAAMASLRVFCETYFPSQFHLRWSPDHLQIIARMEEAGRRGGKFALAMPRGSGKSSLCRAFSLWSVLSGIHPYVVLLAATATKAAEELQSIKTVLLTEDLLREDFPEVCHAVRALDGRANRAKGQRIGDRSTYIEWKSDKIVLPFVEGSKSSGAVLYATGVKGGGVRGRNHQRSHDGKNVRPTLVICDDPQNDDSAFSLLQCDKLYRAIHGAVAGMAGPGKAITIVIPCTVISKGDLSDRLLDREKSPIWTGQKYAMVSRMPDALETLWQEYFTMRKDEMRNGGDGHLATAFYGQNRHEMDAGAMVSWPERHLPDEISALQSAMNLLCDDPASFWAEFQNNPMAADEAAGQLKVELVECRTINVLRGVVPVQATKLIAAVDVQQSILYWTVVAYWPGLGGHLVDYGTWPDQRRRYFKLSEVQYTISRAMADEGLPPGKLEGQLKFALDRLSDQLLARSWPGQIEGVSNVDRMIIDESFEPDTIRTWCLNTKHAARVTPWRGKGIGAKKTPWSDFVAKPGETMGFHTLLTFGNSKNRVVKYLLADTNFWKTLVARRLQMSTGDRSAITLFGKVGQDHKMFAEHCCAEFFQEVESDGRRVCEWEKRAEHLDNHWFDGLVMSMAGASFAGIQIEEAQTVRVGQRVKLSEVYKQKHG